MRRKGKRSPADTVRAHIRADLRLQLARLLAMPSELPDGQVGTVLDDIAIRSLHGYGYTVGLHVRHPDESGRVREDPSLTESLASQPPSLILPA